MNKSLLEKLRSENKQKLIDVFNLTARWYEKFAEKIRNDEMLTDDDWGEMNNDTLIDVSYVDEDGKERLVSLSYLFCKGIEEDCHE